MKQLFSFVIMPFNTDYNDIYQLGIKAAASNCHVKAERLDEQLFTEGMLDRIYRQIEVADFIIADLSDRNPNVFYELGYAHAKDKICILLTKEATDIPFDLKHKRHIVYGESITYLKEELIKNIEWAKSETTAREQSQISVVTKPPSGNLILSEHYVDGTIVLTFDLHNKTDKPSSEISAIYLYTGNQWKIKVDGKDCSYTDSDITPYKHRYFITPPTKKLGKDGWAQVKIKATRTLAQAWKGDVIKDAYTVGGKGILRIETSDGNFDHEFDFNLELTDIPF